MSGHTNTNENIIDYLTFPLSLSQGLLLSDFLQTKAIIKKMIGYGRAYFALHKSKFETNTLAKQAIYLLYNNHLPGAFMVEAEKAITSGELAIYSETKGFTSEGKEFVPDSYEIEEIQKFVNKNNYTDVWDWCKLSFIVPHDQIEQYFEVYKNVNQDQQRFVAKFGKDVKVSINYVMMADFYKEPPTPELLAAYIALRSTQGRKKYVKTFKKTILLRMTGAKSYQVLDEMSTPELEEKLRQLEKRKTFERLLINLEERGLLRGRFILPTNVNFYLLSTSSNAVEIARHYASDIQATERSKQQKEALDLFNQLTAKA